METLAVGGQMARSADEFADWVRPHLPTLYRYAAREVDLIDADRPVEHTERDLDLERAVARLAPRQREVIDLYYFVDLDVATIASTLGCAPGTVRATLHQARAALRRALADPQGEHDE